MPDINSSFTSSITAISRTFSTSDGKKRIQLFGTNEQVHAVAYEAIQTSGMYHYWQRFRVSAGGLVKHNVTVLTDGKEEVKTFLLNASSLAKRLGISNKQIKNLNNPTPEQAQAPLLLKLLEVQVNLAKTLAQVFQSQKKDFYKAMEGFAKQIDHEGVTFFFKAVNGLANSKAIKIEDKILGKGAFGTVVSKDVSVKVAGKTHQIAMDWVLKIPNYNVDTEKQRSILESFENEPRILSILAKRQSDMIGIQELPHKVDSEGLLIPRYAGDLRHAEVKAEHHQSMIRQLLTGLTTLHGQGIIHSDIKPANVLVKDLNAENPKFHIADFGGCKTKKEHRKAFKKAFGEVKQAQGPQRRGILSSAVGILKGARTPMFDPDTPIDSNGKSYISPEYSSSSGKLNFLNKSFGRDYRI